MCVGRVLEERLKHRQANRGDTGTGGTREALQSTILDVYQLYFHINLPKTQISRTESGNLRIFFFPQMYKAVYLSWQFKNA